MSLLSFSSQCGEYGGRRLAELPVTQVPVSVWRNYEGLNLFSSEYLSVKDGIFSSIVDLRECIVRPWKCDQSTSAGRCFSSLGAHNWSSAQLAFWYWEKIRMLCWSRKIVNWKRIMRTKIFTLEKNRRDLEKAKTDLKEQINQLTKKHNQKMQIHKAIQKTITHIILKYKVNPFIRLLVRFITHLISIQQ